MREKAVRKYATLQVNKKQNNNVWTDSLSGWMKLLP